MVEASSASGQERCDEPISELRINNVASLYHNTIMDEEELLASTVLKDEDIDEELNDDQEAALLADSDSEDAVLKSDLVNDTGVNTTRQEDDVLQILPEEEVDFDNTNACLKENEKHESSESEDEDASGRHRGRFVSERKSGDISLTVKARRDIPESLESIVAAEDLPPVGFKHSSNFPHTNQKRDGGPQTDKFKRNMANKHSLRPNIQQERRFSPQHEKHSAEGRKIHINPNFKSAGNQKPGGNNYWQSDSNIKKFDQHYPRHSLNQNNANINRNLIEVRSNDGIRPINNNQPPPLLQNLPPANPAFQLNMANRSLMQTNVNGGQALQFQVFNDGLLQNPAIFPPPGIPQLSIPNAGQLNFLQRGIPIANVQQNCHGPNWMHQGHNSSNNNQFPNPSQPPSDFPFPYQPPYKPNAQMSSLMQNNQAVAVPFPGKNVQLRIPYASSTNQVNMMQGQPRFHNRPNPMQSEQKFQAGPYMMQNQQKFQAGPNMIQNQQNFNAGLNMMQNQQKFQPAPNMMQDQLCFQDNTTMMQAPPKFQPRLMMQPPQPRLTPRTNANRNSTLTAGEYQRMQFEGTRGNYNNANRGIISENKAIRMKHQPYSNNNSALKVITPVPQHELQAQNDNLANTNLASNTLKRPLPQLSHPTMKQPKFDAQILAPKQNQSNIREIELIDFASAPSAENPVKVAAKPVAPTNKNDANKETGGFDPVAILTLSNNKARLPIEDEKDPKTKELRAKLEEQKKKREEVLRKKEERRRLDAVMRRIQQDQNNGNNNCLDSPENVVESLPPPNINRTVQNAPPSSPQGQAPLASLKGQNLIKYMLPTQGLSSSNFPRNSPPQNPADFSGPMMGFADSFPRRPGPRPGPGPCPGPGFSAQSLLGKPPPRIQSLPPVNSNVPSSTESRNCTVRIENLAASTTEAHIHKMCTAVGNIQCLQFNPMARTATVIFKTHTQAENFQRQYHR